MTEAEWLACEDPMAMLIFLKDYSSGFVDYQDIDRKLRLFSCACCRSRRECREDSLLLATIGTAERYADGETTKQELQTARRALKAEREVVGNMFSASELYSAFDTVSWLWGTGSIPARLKDQQVGLRLCTFGRCIFGNLFRPVAVDQSWLTFTVLALAQQMYDSRDFGAMPILADALQDAGCDNEDILSHCRSDGPHVRGCWVVDLVLGKE